MASDDKLRVGIIGTGFGSVVHLPAYQQHPAFEPTMICGTKEKKTSSLAANNEIIGTTDWKQLVKSPDIDVVSIATPPNLHYEMAVEALKNDKHVLCEKPLALTIQQAETMRDQAETSGFTCMVNFEFRYLPVRAYLIDLLRSGHIGDIFSFTIKIDTNSRINPRTQGHNWWSDEKDGGGVLNALGSHYIDLLLQVFSSIDGVYGKRYIHIPKRLNKSTGRMKKVTADDGISVIFETGGVQCFLKINTVASHSQGTVIEVSGSKGSLIIKEDQQLYSIMMGENNVTILPIPRTHQLVREKRSHILVPPTKKILDNFKNGVDNGVSHSPNFDDAYRVQLVLDAIIRSDIQKKYIALDI